MSLILMGLWMVLCDRSHKNLHIEPSTSHTEPSTTTNRYTSFNFLVLCHSTVDKAIVSVL